MQFNYMLSNLLWFKCKTSRAIYTLSFKFITFSPNLMATERILARKSASSYSWSTSMKMIIKEAILNRVKDLIFPKIFQLGVILF